MSDNTVSGSDALWRNALGSVGNAAPPPDSIPDASKKSEDVTARLVEAAEVAIALEERKKTAANDAKWWLETAGYIKKDNDYFENGELGSVLYITKDLVGVTSHGAEMTWVSRFEHPKAFAQAMEYRNATWPSFKNSRADPESAETKFDYAGYDPMNDEEKEALRGNVDGYLDVIKGVYIEDETAAFVRSYGDGFSGRYFISKKDDPGFFNDLIEKQNEIRRG